MTAQFSAALSATNTSSVAVSASVNGTITLAGENVIHATQSIGTSDYEDLDLGEITPDKVGVILVSNLDAANYVDVKVFIAGADSAECCRIPHGGAMLLPGLLPTAANIKAKANSSAVVVQIIAAANA